LFDIVVDLSGLEIAQGLSHVDVSRSSDGFLEDDCALSNTWVIWAFLGEYEVKVKIQVVLKRFTALR
jgi:hypothetical protein